MKDAMLINNSIFDQSFHMEDRMVFFQSNLGGNNIYTQCVNKIQMKISHKTQIEESVSNYEFFF